MSVRNMRPGLWWKFRCAQCLEVKLEVNAGFYQNVAAVTRHAKAKGWHARDRGASGRQPKTIEVVCPGCCKRARKKAVAW